MILGVSEHLRVGLPLCILRVAEEPASQVCSRCWFTLEGTRATVWVGVPVSLDPGDPVPLGVGADVVVSSPLILSVLDHLGVELPLCVVGLGAEPGSKVCSGHRLRLEGLLTF